MQRPRWPVPLIVGCRSRWRSCTCRASDAPRHRDGRRHSAVCPRLTLPQLDSQNLDTLLPLSLACFLIAYNEAIATARLLASRHDYTIDPNRELLGLGGANIAIAVGHGFPSGGGLSQSLVNDQAGARTPFAIVVCSAWMAIVLLFLTGLFTACRSRCSRHWCSRRCRACSSSTSCASCAA